MCVTSCRSEESFKQYFSEMPWLAVPYSDEARRSRLNRLYGIQGGSQPLCIFDTFEPFELINWGNLAVFHSAFVLFGACFQIMAAFEFP